MKIKRNIPIFSTAFLKSPMIVGWRNPRIYLPTHLISDYDAAHLRYMLYHELQHYKHQDALINHFINLAAVCYWFHPFVRYALKKMRDDREIAFFALVLSLAPTLSTYAVNDEHYDWNASSHITLMKLTHVFFLHL